MNGVMAMLAAGALLLSASGSALAGGGWGSVGGGSDGFQVSCEAIPGGTADADAEHPTTLGAKVGGGSDRPTALGGKLDVATGEG